jgi:hypothetical protein
VAATALRIQPSRTHRRRSLSKVSDEPRLLIVRRRFASFSAAAVKMRPGRRSSQAGADPKKLGRSLGRFPLNTAQVWTLDELGSLTGRLSPHRCESMLVEYFGIGDTGA